MKWCVWGVGILGFEVFLTTWVVKILGWDVSFSVGVSVLGDVHEWTLPGAISSDWLWAGVWIQETSKVLSNQNNFLIW